MYKTHVLRDNGRSYYIWSHNIVPLTAIPHTYWASNTIEDLRLCWRHLGDYEADWFSKLWDIFRHFPYFIYLWNGWVRVRITICYRTMRNNNFAWALPDLWRAQGTHAPTSYAPVICLPRPLRYPSHTHPCVLWIVPQARPWLCIVLFLILVTSGCNK